MSVMEQQQQQPEIIQRLLTPTESVAASKSVNDAMKNCNYMEEFLYNIVLTTGFTIGKKHAGKPPEIVDRFTETPLVDFAQRSHLCKTTLSNYVSKNFVAICGDGLLIFHLHINGIDRYYDDPEFIHMFRGSITKAVITNFFDDDEDSVLIYLRTMRFMKNLKILHFETQTEFFGWKRHREKIKHVFANLVEIKTNEDYLTRFKIGFLPNLKRLRISLRNFNDLRDLFKKTKMPVLEVFEVDILDNLFDIRKWKHVPKSIKELTITMVHGGGRSVFVDITSIGEFISRLPALTKLTVNYMFLKSPLITNFDFLKVFMDTDFRVETHVNVKCGLTKKLSKAILSKELHGMHLKNFRITKKLMKTQESEVAATKGANTFVYTCYNNGEAV